MPDGVTGNPAKQDFPLKRVARYISDSFYKGSFINIFFILLPDGVTGNMLDSGSRESRFDP